MDKGAFNIRVGGMKRARRTSCVNDVDAARLVEAWDRVSG